jgi:hypothetical protein
MVSKRRTELMEILRQDYSRRNATVRRFLLRRATLDEEQHRKSCRIAENIGRSLLRQIASQSVGKVFG